MENKGDAPQNNYFKVKNDWFDALIKTKLPGTQMQCVLFIIRMTYGWRRQDAEILIADFTQALQAEKTHVYRALRELKQRKIIGVTKNGHNNSATYSFNKYYNQWVTKIGHTKGVTKKVLEVRPKMVTVPIKRQLKTIKTETQKPKKPVFPVWLDLEVWKEFKKYRQNGRGKFTPYAQELAIKKLEKFRAAGNDPSEVIKQSILHGWSGLFEIKKETREEAQEKQKTNDKLAEYRRQEAL